MQMNNFLAAQGYEMGPVVLYQDNMSTIAMLKRGRPGAKGSRHFDIRYYWLKEKIDNNEVVVEHMPAEKMIANVFTKPIQGAQLVHTRTIHAYQLD